jgi:hypothetical protein
MGIGLAGVRGMEKNISWAKCEYMSEARRGGGVLAAGALV